MGTKSSRRAISGVVLLDKPLGLSSNAALQRAKRLFNVVKAGHTGSLDPLATGLLPLCFGHATKLSSYLLDADKTYDFSCQLGVVTDSGDAEGQIVERRPVGEISTAQVNSVLAGLIGPIDQVPPMFSALKHEGKRLYELARKGIEVERKARRITIYSLVLTQQTADTISCRVRCSKGTYVRTLAEDIGAELGCGAHVSALRRVAVTPFDIAQAITLDALVEAAEISLDALDQHIISADKALAGWPAVTLSADLSVYVRSGHTVRVADAPDSGWVRLYDAVEFIGIGEIIADGRVAPRRLFVNGGS